MPGPQPDLAMKATHAMSTTGLLHRGPALAVAKECAARLRADEPVAAVIQGERGSGKSALLAAMTQGCAAAVELRARCHAAEGNFDFGVVGQLLERLSIVDVDASAGAEGPTQEYRLFDRCYRAVRELTAQGPVVLSIDDVHLADARSARWLSYLARRLYDLPAGLLVTVSSGGSAPRKSAATELLSVLRESAHSHLIRCEPLCAECAGELVARELGRVVDPDLACQYHALTRGNPYLLSQVASQLAAAPGAALDVAGKTVACTVLDWLRQDDPVKAKVAEQFAVSGSGTLETAAMLTGQGEEVAREARATFRDLGLLAPAGPDKFAHPAFGGAIAGMVRPQERAVMHAHAARMFAQLGESAPLAADHVMLAGAIGEPWARLVLRQAARQAAAAGDWLRGASYLNRALLEPGPSHQTLAITAELSALEFNFDIGACLRQVGAIFAFAGADLGADAAMAVAADAALAVECGDAAAAFCAATASLASAGQPERSDLLRLAAPALLFGPPYSPELTSGIRQAVRGLASGPPDMAARQLLSALALSMAARGCHPARCLALALRAAAGGRAGYTDPVHSTVTGAALALIWVGDLVTASDTCAQALETAQRMASPTGEGLALYARSEIAFRRGNLTAALNDVHQTLQLFQLVGASTLEAAAAALLIRVRLTRGEAGIVPQQVKSPAPRASGHPFVLAMGQEANGMIAAAQGNHALALRLFLEAGRQLMAAGLVNPACSSWRSRAVGQLVALGRLWEARTLADTEVALARSWGSPGPLGNALIAAAAAHEGTDRRDLLTEAVSVLEDSGCQLQLARALIGLGQEMLAGTAGPGSTASDMLERGLTLAEDCGAVALAATAQRAMHANGTRPRGHFPSTGLTSAERRVAELVMTGLSNQGVADQLTLSKRTIDTHLGRIYRKLGITGRDRLSEAIFAAGDPDGQLAPSRPALERQSSNLSGFGVYRLPCAPVPLAAGAGHRGEPGRGRPRLEGDFQLGSFQGVDAPARREGRLDLRLGDAPGSPPAGLPVAEAHHEVPSAFRHHGAKVGGQHGPVFVLEAMEEAAVEDGVELPVEVGEGEDVMDEEHGGQAALAGLARGGRDRGRCRVHAGRVQPERRRHQGDLTGPAPDVEHRPAELAFPGQFREQALRTVDLPARARQTRVVGLERLDAAATRQTADGVPRMSQLSLLS